MIPIKDMHLNVYPKFSLGVKEISLKACIDKALCRSLQAIYNENTLFLVGWLIEFLWYINNL